MKKSKNKANIIRAGLAGLCLVCVVGCHLGEEEAPGPVIGDIDFGLGWMGTDNGEEIPSNIYLDFGNNTLPVSHTIESKLPPIGDQGQETVTGKADAMARRSLAGWRVVGSF